MIRKKILRNLAILFMALMTGIVVLPSMVGATVPVEQWNKTFGGVNNDGMTSGQQTLDGGYIMAGYTDSSGAGGKDVWLIKTNSSGVVQWNRTFGGALADYANSVQQTSDGGYIIAGYTSSFGLASGHGANAWLIKIDDNGTEEWNKTYGDVSGGSAKFVRQTSDGGFIFAGSKTVWGWTDTWSVLWLLKTDSMGNIEWNKPLGYFGGANSVQQTFDGGYILAGTAADTGNGASYALLLKFDSQGNTQWNNSFNKTAGNYVNFVQQTANGGYVVAGIKLNHVWFVNINSNGTEEWNRSFGGAGTDNGLSVMQTLDNGYVLAGMTGSFGAGSYDFWLIKTDSNGSHQWNKTFGGPQSDAGYFGQQTSDGGYILGGYTNSFGAGGNDAWLVKIASDAEITPTPTPTPTPQPLTASITLPIDNSYSEKLINFSGTISGGVEPFTVTWESNKIGLLNSSVTSNTVHEFNKELPFSNISGMNQHTITMTVQDSIGNAVTKSVTVNVVKQKIKILVVPIATSGTELSSENRIRIKKLADDTREYYLRSSYGAICLDFNLSFSSIVNVAKPNIDDVSDSVLMNTLNLSESSPYSINLSQYGIVVIVNTENLNLDRGRSNLIGELKTLPKDKPMPALVVPFAASKSFGIWVHEIGHLLGFSIVTSETYGSLLLWTGSECGDLYVCSDVLAWDVMAYGVEVFNSSENSRINQPTDMSVLSKTKLRWLNKEMYIGTTGSYPIISTENLHYGDYALIYKTSLDSSAEYYIEAREVIQPSYYKWTLNNDLGSGFDWYALNNGIVIYKVQHYDSDGTIKISVLRHWDEFFGPTFFAIDSTSAEITDYSEFLKFSVVESNMAHPYNAKIRIDPCDLCASLKGFKMEFISKMTSMLAGSYSSNNGTVPRLSLHAITPDGKHIGINRTSGLYEMQISGGVSSGDTFGEQWIFVPVGTQVRYYIDSNFDQYFNEHPELNASNTTANFTITSIQYGENPQRVELPDGSSVITNTTVSLPMEDTIAPNETKEVNIILPDVRYINGTVIDSVTKLGIAGVTVRTNTSNSTTTDASGFYSLAVAADVYDLTAKFDPTYYLNTSVTVSTVGVAAASQDIELTKKPMGNIMGGVRRK